MNEYSKKMLKVPTYNLLREQAADLQFDPDTVLGHHGVGIFWNAAEWTMEG